MSVVVTPFGLTLIAVVVIWSLYRIGDRKVDRYDARCDRIVARAAAVRAAVPSLSRATLARMYAPFSSYVDAWTKGDLDLCEASLARVERIIEKELSGEKRG